MFGTVGRRAVDSVVAVFAVLGFCFVPLGQKTGFEHTLALLRTTSARDAGAGLLSAVARARALLVDVLASRDPSAPLPLPSASPSGSSGVRAVPPRLKDR